MSRVSLLNREANFRPNICQKKSDKGIICDRISKSDVEIISAPFEELKKEGKSISSTDDLVNASQIVREREIARKRVLRREENSGFILVGSLTCLGTLAIGSLIFMAIKLIIVG